MTENLTMAVPTLIAAVLLIAVGAMGYASQDPDKASITALIPAFLGGALAICGLLAFKDGALYVQAGGGVVADSDPLAEYQETLQKSGALKRAAEEAWRFA